MQRVLERRVFAWLGIVWLLCVIGDGAFFFFLLVGADNIHPVETKNFWLNWSIQVLNGLFTYSHVISTPWRVANLVHLSGCSRSSAVGRDWCTPLEAARCPRPFGSLTALRLAADGLPTDAIWFHLPRRPRAAILALFVFGGAMQFVNQAMRALYPTYEASNGWPGVLLCNLFFALSFAAAGAAGALQAVHEARLRRVAPQQFEPGPADMARYALSEMRSGRRPSELVLAMLANREVFDEAVHRSRRESGSRRRSEREPHEPLPQHPQVTPPVAVPDPVAVGAAAPRDRERTESGLSC